MYGITETLKEFVELCQEENSNIKYKQVDGQPRGIGDLATTRQWNEQVP